MFAVRGGGGCGEGVVGRGLWGGGRCLGRSLGGG